MDVPYEGMVNGNTDGFKFDLKPPSTLSVINTLGYDVPPGYSISMAFTVEETKRLSEPYHSCTRSPPEHGQGRYSYFECKNVCVHKKVVYECGCYPIVFFTKINYTALNIPNCASYLLKNSSKAWEMLKCQDDVLQYVNTNIGFHTGCNCYSPCEEISYSLTMSQSEWPSKSSINAFPHYIFKNKNNKTNIKAYSYYQNLLNNNTSQESINNWVRRHFVRVTCSQIQELF